MHWDSSIVWVVVFGAFVFLFWIAILLERILKRQIAMQRYLRRTERAIDMAELHLRMIKGYIQDQFGVSEQERSEAKQALLKAYDNIEEAFQRDAQDQKFGGGPPENQ
jgi:hypothetical protein